MPDSEPTSNEIRVQQVSDLEAVEAPTLAADDVDPLTGLRGAQLAGLARLREPFREGELLYMPRLTCRDCKALQKNYRACENTRHVMERPCPKCGQDITSAHIDLAYVGHAALTHRLLSVDPTWTWRPMGRTPAGTPAMADGGMWIELTVCGVTRPGFGDGGDRSRPGKTEGDFTKEAVGDALRNAGMRFGMALDLWHKGAPFDLAGDADDGPATESRPEPARQRPAGHERAPEPPAQAAPTFTEDQVVRAHEILAMAKAAKSADEVGMVYKMAVREGLVLVHVVDGVAAKTLGQAVVDLGQALRVKEANEAAAEAAAVSGVSGW